MITTDKLKEIAVEVEYLGKAEKVKIKKPKGIDPLPLEWEEKLGKHTFQQPFYAVVEDVSLCGPVLVGIKDGDVILDTAYYGRIDLWERNAPYFQWAYQAYYETPVQLGTVVSLAGVWSHNYFHWVLDTLPRIESIRKFHEKHGEEIIILVPASPPPFVVESLEKTGLAWRAATDAHYKVDKLIVFSTRREKGRVAPSIIKDLEWLKNGGGAFTNPNLYISRKNAKTRRVRNEANGLDEFLMGQGYSMIVPEHMPFSGQIDMFKLAENIIAPHGAGLVNMAWCDEPPVIVELVTPAYENPCCWLIGEAIGADYRYLICDPVPHEDMKVDLEKLEQVLDGKKEVPLSEKNACW